MAAFEFGGVSRPLTGDEQEFLQTVVVGKRPPHLDVWLHEDDDGSPWLIIAMDMVLGNSVCDVLRLDYDGRTARGGWSPSFLNGDDGGRANACGVDFSAIDGFDAAVDDVQATGVRVRQWFEAHYQAWPSSDRRARWD